MVSLENVKIHDFLGINSQLLMHNAGITVSI